MIGYELREPHQHRAALSPGTARLCKKAARECGLDRGAGSSTLGQGRIKRAMTTSAQEALSGNPRKLLRRWCRTKKAPRRRHGHGCRPASLGLLAIRGRAHYLFDLNFSPKAANADPASTRTDSRGEFRLLLTVVNEIDSLSVTSLLRLNVTESESTHGCRISRSWIRRRA
jgi:hypothetical protein